MTPRKPQPEPTALNREDWLTKAVIPLTDLINESTDLTLNRDVRVSCGWPGGKSVNKIIGQCWPTHLGKGTAQLFISPLLVKPVQVLETLLHELIHAADDCEHGHRGPFVKACKAVGLEGKPTATVAGKELRARLAIIAEDLGAYPHNGINPKDKVKTQSTRMIKLECPECEYVLRTTRKWIEVALPVCENGHDPIFFEEAA
jgi:hypothetical protein